MNIPLPKLCHYALDFMIFLSLLMFCYFLYMKEAINEYQEGAISVTKQEKELNLEAPALTICPNPSFKPSMSKMHELDIPTRDMFTMDSKITRNTFKKRNQIQNIAGVNFSERFFLQHLHTVFH